MPRNSPPNATKSVFLHSRVNSPRLQNEKQWIAHAGTDSEAFGKLYDAYYPKIYGYCYRITGDYTLAADITAETFLKAFQHIGAFRWRGISISSWFFRIATNELNQYFRKRSYSPELLTDLSAGDQAAWANRHALSHENNDIITQIDKYQEFQHIRNLLLTLPQKYREPITLRFFEELSIREVAAILDKKEGTVKSLLSRGLDKLKKMLEDPATNNGSESL